MAEIVDISTRRLPSLVQICQRASATNIDHISNLGDELSFNLAKPILECCNAEQLLRIEESSPHLETDTQELWKRLCYSVYPLAVDKHRLTSGNEPSSWRDHYLVLQNLEARRLEEATAKLRIQRHEAEERKKEREVKITDRVPPPKRPRTGWGSNPAPKTLFQKTRSEASRLRNNLYHARIIPPMPQNGRQYTVLPKDPNTTVEFLPPPKDSNRITVNNVVKSRATSSTSPSSSNTPTPCSRLAPPHIPHTLATIAGSPDRKATSTPISPASNHGPVKPPPQRKKDPMASLFVPKRRAQC